MISDTAAGQLANMRIGDTILNPVVGCNILNDELARGIQQAGINATVETAIFNLPAFLIAPGDRFTRERNSGVGEFQLGGRARQDRSGAAIHHRRCWFY
jgi:hypothetical protein